MGDLDGNLIVGSPGRVHFPLIDVREFCLDQSIINSASVPDLECVAFPLGTRFSFSCQLLHKHVLGPALRDWIESAQGEGATGREKHPLLLPETWRWQIFLALPWKSKLSTLHAFLALPFYRALSFGNFLFVIKLIFKPGTFLEAYSWSATLPAERSWELRSFRPHSEKWAPRRVPFDMEQGVPISALMFLWARKHLMARGVLGPVRGWAASPH